MSESFSIERRKLMRFLGAKVVLTNPAHKGSGMVLKANELAEKHGFFQIRQFENEANAWIHAETTGPEILEAFQGTRLDFFCTAFGTGGTLNGVGRVLRDRSPETQIVVCEPDNAPMLHSQVATEYDAVTGQATEPHPLWRPHLLQGWSPDFIPRLCAEAQDLGYIDHLKHVSGDTAMQASEDPKSQF